MLKKTGKSLVTAPGPSSLDDKPDAIHHVWNKVRELEQVRKENQPGLPTAVLRAFQSHAMASDCLDEHFLELGGRVCKKESYNLTSVGSLAYRNNSRPAS